MLSDMNLESSLGESAAALFEVFAEDFLKAGDTASWAMADTMAKEIRAYISASTAEAVEPGEQAGWRVRDKHLQGRQWRLVADLSVIPFTDRDLYEIVPVYTLASPPPASSPPSSHVTVTSDCASDQNDGSHTALSPDILGD